MSASSDTVIWDPVEQLPRMHDRPGRLPDHPIAFVNDVKYLFGHCSIHHTQLSRLSQPIRQLKSDPLRSNCGGGGGFLVPRFQTSEFLHVRRSSPASAGRT